MILSKGVNLESDESAKAERKRASGIAAEAALVWHRIAESPASSSMARDLANAKSDVCALVAQRIDPDVVIPMELCVITADLWRRYATPHLAEHAIVAVWREVELRDAVKAEREACRAIVEKFIDRWSGITGGVTVFTEIWKIATLIAARGEGGRDERDTNQDLHRDGVY